MKTLLIVLTALSFLALPEFSEARRGPQELHQVVYDTLDDYIGGGQQGGVQCINYWWGRECIDFNTGRVYSDMQGDTTAIEVDGETYRCYKIADGVFDHCHTVN